MRAMMFAEAAFGRPNSTWILGFPLAAINAAIGAAIGAVFGAGCSEFARRAQWPGKTDWRVPLSAVLIVVRWAGPGDMSVLRRESLNRPRVIASTEAIGPLAITAAAPGAVAAAGLLWDDEFPESSSKARPMLWNRRIASVSSKTRA